MVIKIISSIIASDGENSLNISLASMINQKLKVYFYESNHETNEEDSPHYFDEGRRMNLKLEAQKIRDFSSLKMDWTKWKNRTECAFDGSGYGKI